MRQVVTLPIEQLRTWAFKRAPKATFLGKDTQALAVTIDEKVVAAVFYFSYTGDNVEMSIVSDSPRWASPKIISGLLSYPFDQLEVWRVTVTVDVLNTRAVKMNERLGFQLEGRIRMRTPQDDILILGLTRPEADRWLRYGRKKQEGSRSPRSGGISETASTVQ